MSEWIRVEERLPDLEETVIANGYDGKTAFPAQMYNPGHWRDLEEPDGEGAYARAFRVTHWMPLPEPPI